MTTILAFLAARPWLKFVLGVVAALVLLFAFIYLITASMDRALESSHSEGMAEERAESLNQTISRTQEANNAAEAIERDPAVRDAECMRHARNPEDCGGH